MPIVNVTEIFEKKRGKKTKLQFEQTIDALIDGYPCIAFSKSYCPYNAALKDMLAIKYGLMLLVIDINQTESPKEIQAYLKSKTGIATVPQVFVEGQYLGNHDSIMELHAKGELFVKLKGHAKRDGGSISNSSSSTVGGSSMPCASAANVATRTYQPLFWFPTSINKWAIRATGLLSCFVSFTLATYMFLEAAENDDNDNNDDMMGLGLGLASFALFVDFMCRFFAGSRFSPIALLGGFLAAKSQLTPIPRPGAPKQFASFCGTLFSGLGTLSYLYLCNPIVGGIFLFILGICTGMEGAFDYCLGCKFFAIGEMMILYRQQHQQQQQKEQQQPKKGAAYQKGNGTKVVAPQAA